MSTVTEMRVNMCCAGCESTVKKALEKIEGINEIEIDMGMQKVTVNSCVEEKKILKAVRRKGRRAELWQFPYQPELRNFNQQYPNQCQGSGPGTFTQPPPSSSYNYYKHGYYGDEYHGNYSFYNSSQSSSFGGGRTGDVFSDENPHGCSIM